MAPSEPWQPRPREAERGKERIGGKPMVNKRSTTEVESVSGGWANHQHVGECHHHCHGEERFRREKIANAFQ